MWGYLSFPSTAWSSWAWRYWLRSSVKHTTDHWSLNALHVLHFDNLSHIRDLNKEVTKLHQDLKSSKGKLSGAYSVYVQ